MEKIVTTFRLRHRSHILQVSPRRITNYLGDLAYFIIKSYVFSWFHFNLIGYLNVKSF